MSGTKVGCAMAELEIDDRLVEQLRRVAEEDQKEALSRELVDRVVRPLYRAISALANRDPERARRGLRITLEVRAEPVSGTLLSTAEVAERFRVSQQQVRRWCEDGLIRAERTPGGTWRIPAEQFEGVGRLLPGGPRRRVDVRDVAGAWKDHPELVRALREREDE